jgi:glycosyltransferase involved in cell wall biosynthesis
MPKKLVIIITSLSVGGAELMLFKLLRKINLKKFKPTVISLTSYGEIGSRINGLGIPVHSVELSPNLSIFIKLIRFLKLLKDLKPDIIHTWMYHSDLIGGIAAKIIGCDNILWSIRCTDILTDGVSKNTRYIRKICAGLSNIIPTNIICVAHKAKKVHVKIGYDYQKMIVLGNGFDLNLFKYDLDSRVKIRESLNIKAGSLVIGSIGRFNNYKDHHNFIMAAQHLTLLKRKVYFLMIGRDVDINNYSLKSWIEEVGNPNRFKLLGEQREIVKLLSAMDIFCLHSKSEGFPNVLGEAMCMGLPSVVTNVGDSALLLGNSGVVVPSQDPNALAKGLLSLINKSEEERQLIGQLARKRIKENYSMEKIYSKYEILYEKILIK